MKASIFLLLLFMIACTGQPQETADTAISEARTREVLEHHWDAFQANDLEGTMADYTEESVLITPDNVFRGLTEIRENFVGAFNAFPKDSSTLKLNKTVVVNDVGYIIWEAAAPAFDLTYGTDTFIVQNGKIIRQTYAGVARAK